MIGSGKAYGHGQAVPCAHRVSYRRFVREARGFYRGHDKVPASVRPRLLSMRGCSRPSVRRAETRLWVAQVHAHNQRRRRAVFIATYEPYSGCYRTVCGRFAVPACIVYYESSGIVHNSEHPYGSSGLYQIELSTWYAHDGERFAAFPYLASKDQQSIVATAILRSQGFGAWTTAAGCGY